MARLERALADFEAETAMDDPFVLVDRRSIGEAFAGEVADIAIGVAHSDHADLVRIALFRTGNPHASGVCTQAYGVQRAVRSRHM
ncbi:hypothetical protein EBN03_27860 [Nocardia stercoris]|uniref:Uncharacterized protein n=1 Tax=Nocardia stercoris TaxID=2483361 RepID=A0A3M2KWE6_9NOCA|nr:hypothetical protein EBN03_27860 [Nocardia stercoris]